MTHEATQESTSELRSKASVPMARLPEYTSVHFTHCSRGVCASWWPPLHGLWVVWCLSLPTKTQLGDVSLPSPPSLQRLTISQTHAFICRTLRGGLLEPCLPTVFLTFVSVKDERLMESEEPDRRQGRMDERKEKESRVGVARQSCHHN